MNKISKLTVLIITFSLLAACTVPKETINRPELATPVSTSNAATQSANPASPGNTSGKDTTPPALSNAKQSVDTFYYNGNCGQTDVKVSVQASDNSGKIAKVWLSYRYFNWGNGKTIDEVGIYHPIEAAEKQISFDADKVRDWLTKGAQPTDTVKRLLNKKEFTL